MPHLEREAVFSFVAPGGPLSRAIKGFELRPQQQQMIDNVLAAYNEEAIALIEAGTGTGKSLAYLLPALLWATRFSERTVIATHTIALQEQLLFKDIPALLRALDLDLKVVLVKGMGNYLCWRKHSDALEELLLVPAEEQQELRQLEQWRSAPHDGSRSSLSFPVRSSTWERVAAEADSCTSTRCPYYTQCPFFNARKCAADASIIVTNHSMLFADLAMRGNGADAADAAAARTDKQQQSGIFPSYNRIIIDEAHNLEEVATEHLAAKTSSLDLFKLLARCSTEKQGRLYALYSKVFAAKSIALGGKEGALHITFTTSLGGECRQLVKQVEDTFDAFASLVDRLVVKDTEASSGILESKFRLLPHHVAAEAWKEQVLPHAKAFCDGVERYAQSVDAWVSEVQKLCQGGALDQIQGLCCDVTALTNRLRSSSTILRMFSSAEWQENSVRWIEQKLLAHGPNVAVVNATLDLSTLLANLLFNRHATVVLCSATLTTNNHFAFVRRRLGLIERLIGDRLVLENIYGSPFNFQRQALLLVPNDMPDPNQENFLEEACERIFAAIEASRGNAFVLFTSYAMLLGSFELLAPRLEAAGYKLFRQGHLQRRTLLELFSKTDRSVLFGTNSFWEGVDVIGDALRCVIIVKLPFKVPSEPIVQARAEAIRKAGGNAFQEYSLPSAIIKFIQGVGRLVRHRFDRGCVVCLDTRLINKNYGKHFLSSLPAHTLFIGSTQRMAAAMETFYRKTYYLACQQRH